MTIRIRLFALAKERAGAAEVEVELPGPATVGDLRRVLRTAVPPLDDLCRTAMISVDEDYATDETPIGPDSRLALIPPVSGGASHRDD